MATPRSRRADQLGVSWAIGGGASLGVYYAASIELRMGERGGPMRYAVQVVVGKRRTWLIDANDPGEARTKAGCNEKEGEKYVHSDDEIVVVADPELEPLGAGDGAAKGLGKVLRRPGESEDAARRRAFGEDDHDPSESTDSDGPDNA